MGKNKCPHIKLIPKDTDSEWFVCIKCGISTQLPNWFKRIRAMNKNNG